MYALDHCQDIVYIPRMASEPCEPVGIVEIAARLGVKRNTVDQWIQRAIEFPPARWTVGGRPAWNWPDVEQWATETGRLYSHAPGK